MNMIGLMVGVLVAAILATMSHSSDLPTAERAQVRQAVRDLQYIRNDLQTYLIGCDLSPVMLSGGLASLPHYTTTACMPGAPLMAQAGPVGGLISSASLTGLSLTATLGGQALPALKGQTVTLTAHVIGSAVQWVCTGPAGTIGPAC